MDMDKGMMFMPQESMHRKKFIKVIGVGEGGCNAVNRMYKDDIKGVELIACNTDGVKLDSLSVKHTILLSRDGLGAGGNPESARQDALRKEEEIKSYFLEDTQMVFITTGMGGGTGTGASPEIARMLKEIKIENSPVEEILVVGVVTTPFKYERKERFERAIKGIDELKKYADAVIVVNNDSIFELGDLTLTQAFSKADEVLSNAVISISKIMTEAKHMQIDFHDVNAVLSKSGAAVIGFGQAEGENRAREAVNCAFNSPFLNNNSIKGARTVLVNVSYSEDNEIRLSELTAINEEIQKELGEKVEWLKMGQTFDNSLGNQLTITIIATGYNVQDVIAGDKKIIQIVLEKNNDAVSYEEKMRQIEKAKKIEDERRMEEARKVEESIQRERERERRWEEARQAEEDKRRSERIEKPDIEPDEKNKINANPFDSIFTDNTKSNNIVDTSDRSKILKEMNSSTMSIREMTKNENTLLELENVPAASLKGWSSVSSYKVDAPVPEYHSTKYGIKPNTHFLNVSD
ncbi:MAG: cell division FtsZ family protein [Bacteroidales bacterium]|jgi:cell division protein FtsZ|nr:cell division FtsZ family protein [Bacteroidales bacterium]